MNKTLNITVRESKRDGQTQFEGVAQLDGGTAFKLTKSRSTETRFTTRSSLTQSANNFAKRYGLKIRFDSNSKTGNATGSRTSTKSRTASKASIASDSVIY